LSANNKTRQINYSVMCCSCHKAHLPYLPQVIRNISPNLLRYTFPISTLSVFLPFCFVPFIFSQTELPETSLSLPSSSHSSADCLFWCMVAVQSTIRMSRNGKTMVECRRTQVSAARVVVMETTRIPAL